MKNCLETRASHLAHCHHQPEIYAHTQEQPEPRLHLLNHRVHHPELLLGGLLQLPVDEAAGETQGQGDHQERDHHDDHQGDPVGVHPGDDAATEGRREAVVGGRQRVTESRLAFQGLSCDDLIVL